MQEFGLAITREIDDRLVERVSEAMQILVQELRKAYDQQFTLKGGNAGASLTYEVKRVGKILEAVVGPSEAGKYLAYLEFGEKGTEGQLGAPALYTRSKAPPVRNIYQWIVRAGIGTPEVFVNRAKANALRAISKRKHPMFDAKKGAPWYSTDPAMVFAFFIALKRKKFGRPGLRVLERVMAEQTVKLQQYING